MELRFKGVSRLTKVKPSPEDLAIAKEYLATLANDLEAQQAFFEWTKKWKTTPWLYLQMQKFELLSMLEKEVVERFREYHAKIKTQNERRNAEAKRFLQAFADAGIEAAVLKGNLLIHTTYMDTGYKKMNDFDILVRKEDWGKIQDIYFELDYIPLGFGWGGEKQEPTKFSHTGIPFISRNFDCIIGTQWGLKSPTSKYNLDLEEAWATAKDFDFEGVTIKQLAPEYNLLHLILHMGIYKCGIRDCMDVYNLLQTAPEMDEDRLVALFKKSNASEKAYFTLMLTDLCSGVVSPSLLAKLKPSATGYVGKRLEKRLALHERTGDMHLAYHDYFQDIEMALFNFNLFPKFHQRLFTFFKINKLIFWPREEIMLRLSDRLPSDSLASRIWARIEAPYLVFALIAEEIGWGITMLLFAKLSWDLLLSLKNYITKPPSYFDYLKGRGIDPKDIIKAVKNIE